LDNKPDITSVTQLGTRIRVLVGKAVSDPVAYVQALLQTGCVEAKVDLTRPNLEDVFVSNTGDNRKSMRGSE
jgi:ABC-2 type transport system ATP-binding protein